MLLDLSGIINYDTSNWINLIASAMLGGKLYTFVTSTRLKHHASHNDRSVTCHVSEIQKGADLYRCHLSRHQNRRRSDARNSNGAYFKW